VERHGQGEAEGDNGMIFVLSMITPYSPSTLNSRGVSVSFILAERANYKLNERLLDMLMDSLPPERK
jgi:hypothetical protein